ncbi:MAG: electron transfer flavoprotein subunit beta/FixA family protein [Syntrophobacterales bacterium]|jgi:electron transfer flavoprotein beta subunit|nr:electron transfer flavoprotein subunit beta/FixA family protein [Syntrophobacterales bacterium]
MNIVVCVKQVIDPEAPSSVFRIDEATQKGKNIDDSPPVLDPYGEYALEGALRLKADKGGKVTVISIGNDFDQNAMKKSLAIGADELILVEDDSLKDLDAYGTVCGLVQAIKKVGDYDLILTGREASDTNAGQTGSGIAEAMGLPLVTLVQQIDIDGSQAKIQRVITDGYESVTIPLPAVLTISNEIGEVRFPNMKGIMAAKKMKPTVYGPGDIGMDTVPKKSKMVRLYQEVSEAHCEFIKGESPEEMAVNLAEKLREAKLF